MKHKTLIVAEGLPFILPLAILTITFHLVSFRITSLIFLALTLFVTFFFRNPERAAPADPDIVVSPADGLVLKVDDSEGISIPGRLKRVSIFLSVFDVHVNWAPLPGVIKQILYSEGKFFFAHLDKASIHNERNMIIMNDEKGRQIAFIQIAGIIARRIVCWVKEGMRVVRGDRIGLIRFGSRVEVYLPQDSEILIKAGDRVKGGETPIGRLK